jgi:uncharacterized protein (TIGR02271 family)
MGSMRGKQAATSALHKDLLAMTTTDQSANIAAWRGHDLVDSDGSKIGSISDIYADEDTGQPEWIAVSTGLFGTKVSFVPLAGATARGNELVSRWTKEQVKDAPRAEADGRLSQDEEAALYRHYGMAYGESRSDSGLPEGTVGGQTGTGTGTRTGTGTGTTDTVGHDTSGPTTDSAMTRSEEELRVGTTRQEAGRVRLRKWVETEQVSTSVPVAREEIRVEREPITDANIDRATAGPDISEEEHEVTLYEERAVAEKVTVPKERIRLDKTVVTDEERVDGEVRKERIEVDGDGSVDAGADVDRRTR